MRRSILWLSLVLLWMTFANTIPSVFSADEKPSVGDIRFERRAIDETPPQDPWVKIAGDIDGDGKPDVVIGGRNGPLVWYANSGWKKSLIADGGYSTVGGQAADIDGDGDLDIVLGGIVWYENPRPHGNAAVDRWRQHRVADHKTHDVSAADLDGDGRTDLVSRDQSAFGADKGNRIVLWKQQAPDSWAQREIVCPSGEGVALADLDRDGDLDIVVAGRWYENDGRIIDGGWKERAFTTAWTHPHCKAAAADFNGDGRLDVVIAPSELKTQMARIAWYEAPADPKQGNWSEHIIEASTEAVVHALRVADFNGDKLPDVATAEMHQGVDPDEVRVHLNGGAGQSWRKVVAATTGSHDIAVADFDGDGRIDIMGANWSGPFQPVEIWLNRPSTNR